MKQLSLIAGLLLLILPIKAQDSPQVFVQKFYDWYTPIALKDHNRPASDIALQKRVTLFSSELVKALQEDSQAQAQAPGEIVGMDWDPFLNSQDPDEHYEAAKVTHIGDRYFVDVYGRGSSRKRSKPDVIAELEKQGKSWIFVNFHSPDGHNLLASLKALSAARHQKIRLNGSLTPRSSRTPPALQFALSQLPDSSTPLSALAQVGPVTFFR